MTLNGFPQVNTGIGEVETYELRLLNAYRSMPEAWRPAFIRLGIRILNDDTKVMRLIEMLDRGQISQAQFFSMM